MPIYPNPLPLAYPASAGSAEGPPLDPALRSYFLNEWRVHMTALRYLAPLLGYESRLPPKEKW